MDKLIIRDSSHLHRSLKILDLLDYNVRTIRDESNPYAAIIDPINKTVSWIYSPTYNKAGLDRVYFSDAKIIREINNKRSNRRKTGKSIIRIDGNGNEVIYKNMEELLRLNPTCSYAAKIYQVIGSTRPMYKYHWKYAPNLNNTKQLKLELKL